MSSCALVWFVSFIFMLGRLLQHVQAVTLGLLKKGKGTPTCTHGYMYTNHPIHVFQGLYWWSGYMISVAMGTLTCQTYLTNRSHLVVFA